MISPRSSLLAPQRFTLDPNSRVRDDSTTHIRDRCCDAGLWKATEGYFIYLYVMITFVPAMICIVLLCLLPFGVVLASSGKMEPTEATPLHKDTSSSA